MMYYAKGGVSQNVNVCLKELGKKMWFVVQSVASYSPYVLKSRKHCEMVVGLYSGWRGSRLGDNGTVIDGPEE